MPTLPRTAREFAENNIAVVTQCTAGCNARERHDPEAILLSFGEDFDMLRGVAELSAGLYCSQCGADHPGIYFASAATPYLEPKAKRQEAAVELRRSA